jgi:hypothetical protein
MLRCWRQSARRRSGFIRASGLSQRWWRTNSHRQTRFAGLLLVPALALLLLISAVQAQQRALPLDVLRSGIEFSGSDVRGIQSDDLANPGFLWVERGEKSWNDSKSGGSCASCHGEASGSMRGVAARYPAFDAASGTVLDLEARINDCRVRRQKQHALNPTICSASPPTLPCNRGGYRWRPGSTGPPARHSIADARFTTSGMGR